MNRRRASILILCLSLIAVGGCSVDQQAEVASYRSVLDAGQTAPLEPYEPDQPLSLDQALRLANANNERLAIRGEDYLQALIDQDRAAARFLPTVSFAPSFAMQDDTSIGGESELISQFIRERTRDMPLEADFDLNLIGGVANVHWAAATAEARRALLLDLRDDILLDVAATYYQILRSQRQTSVLAHSIEVQQRRLTDVRARQAAGTAVPLDVAQVRAQVARTRAALIQARHDVSNGRATLALLIGEREVGGELTDELTVPRRIAPFEDLLEAAWTQRHDLAAAQARIEAAAQNLRRAWSRYFPSVSLELAYFLDRQSFPPDVDWLGLVELHVPIFSAGLVHADVRTAWSQLRQARLNRSLVKRRASKQLRVALENLEGSEDRLEPLGVQVEAAQEALDRAEQAYAAGLATNLDALVAQDRLLSAQLELASERLNHKLDYLTLRRALGALDTNATADTNQPSPPSATDERGDQAVNQ